MCSIKEFLSNNCRPVLIYTLVLTALHSFAVGLALIFMPSDWIRFFGFHGYENNFFRTMGGVFHLVMTAAYILGYISVKQQKIHFLGMIPFSIIAKTFAFIYLWLYYFLVDPVLIIILAGLGDGLMSLIILLLYHFYHHEIE